MQFRDIRSKIWVNPFQSQLFTRVAVYWLIYTFTLFNLLFVWKLIQEGQGNLWDQFVRTLVDNVPLFMSFAVVVPWIGLDAVRFSNRLVGPLARFRGTIQKVTVGEPVRKIRLRKDDFLHDMADDVNALLETLDARGLIHWEEAAPGKTSEAGKR